MRIGIIGGLDRSRADYEQLSAAYGLDAEFHDGAMTARGARGLEHIVDRCDVVVIITELNSHGAVQLARRRMRLRGREPLLVRRCGVARFAALLAALQARAHASHAA
jgi:hypothetical protein